MNPNFKWFDEKGKGGVHVAHSTEVERFLKYFPKALEDGFGDADEVANWMEYKKAEGESESGGKGKGKLMKEPRCPYTRNRMFEGYPNSRGAVGLDTSGIDWIADLHPDWSRLWIVAIEKEKYMYPYGGPSFNEDHLMDMICCGASEEDRKKGAMIMNRDQCDSIVDTLQIGLHNHDGDIPYPRLRCIISGKRKEAQIVDILSHHYPRLSTVTRVDMVKPIPYVNPNQPHLWLGILPSSITCSLLKLDPGNRSNLAKYRATVDLTVTSPSNSFFSFDGFLRVSVEEVQRNRRYVDHRRTWGEKVPLTTNEYEYYYTDSIVRNALARSKCLNYYSIIREELATAAVPTSPDLTYYTSLFQLLGVGGVGGTGGTGQNRGKSVACLYPNVGGAIVGAYAVGADHIYAVEPFHFFRHQIAEWNVFFDARCPCPGGHPTLNVNYGDPRDLSVLRPAGSQCQEYDVVLLELPLFNHEYFDMEQEAHELRDYQCSRWETWKQKVLLPVCKNALNILKPGGYLVFSAPELFEIAEDKILTLSTTPTTPTVPTVPTAPTTPGTPTASGTPTMQTSAMVHIPPCLRLNARCACWNKSEEGKRYEKIHGLIEKNRSTFQKYNPGLKAEVQRVATRAPITVTRYNKVHEALSVRFREGVLGYARNAHKMTEEERNDLLADIFEADNKLHIWFLIAAQKPDVYGLKLSETYPNLGIDEHMRLPIPELPPQECIVHTHIPQGTRCITEPVPILGKIISLLGDAVITGGGYLYKYGADPLGGGRSPLPTYIWKKKSLPSSSSPSPLLPPSLLLPSSPSTTTTTTTTTLDH
jgi:hypothetical protein